MIIHVVKQGETVYSIAGEYGVPPRQIIEDNGLADAPILVSGQTLVILFPDVTHTVRPGDTVYSIARMHEMSVKQLYRNNPQLSGLPRIVPGQVLTISYSGEKMGMMEVNGYAYPFVSKPLLRSTLSYLTYLTPFTYGITETGGLVDLNDQELIALANEYTVTPLMHLSTLTEDGGFSNELASLVLNDMTVQNNLIENIVQTMGEKGYLGLDVDFEYVFPQDGPGYAQFIDRLTKRLNPIGYQVIVALAPKTSSNQKGLLYEAHDYAALGRAANAVLLMTYEWGYAYGPPMAVSPINSVRAVLDYAVTQIPREKIYLGMPNYGYDWPLPFVQGETKAQSISNVRGVEIAAENGAEISYSDSSQAPFFNYTAPDGVNHEVWFEDARSVRAKLALVSEYGLLGVGYWNMMRPFPQNWRVLNALYNIVDL